VRRPIGPFHHAVILKHRNAVALPVPVPVPVPVFSFIWPDITGLYFCILQIQVFNENQVSGYHNKGVLLFCPYIYIYRVSQEECSIRREGVPYVKVHRYNPKHLCPKLNGYVDNGQRSLKL